MKYLCIPAQALARLWLVVQILLGWLLVPLGLAAWTGILG